MVPGWPGRAIRAGSLGDGVLLGAVLYGVGRFDVVAPGTPKENASGVGKAGARSGWCSGRGLPVDGVTGGVSFGVGMAGIGGGRGIAIASGAGAGIGGGSGRLVSSGGAGAGCASAEGCA